MSVHVRAFKDPFKAHPFVKIRKLAQVQSGFFLVKNLCFFFTKDMIYQ